MLKILDKGGRNSGIKAARGKYIAFIDQDDYYHPDAFEKVYNHLVKADLDILIVDCTYERPGKANNQLQHNFPHREVMTGDEQIVKNSLPWAPWKFIIRRELILENHCFFKENVRIEDVDWVHKLVHLAMRVQYQPILFIHYIKNQTSTTMTSYCSPETMYSTVSCGTRLHELVDTTFKDSSNEVKQCLEKTSAFFLYLGFRNYLFCRNSLKNKIYSIKEAKKQLPSCKVHYLVKTAMSAPCLYAFLSNLSALCLPSFLMVYRKVKYRQN
jgi:glycosyltransferase involved in cell wall biosynthesis